MQFARSGRFVFIAQWVAAVLLPVFFFIGRSMLGAGLGWMAIAGIVRGRKPIDVPVGPEWRVGSPAHLGHRGSVPD